MIDGEAKFCSIRVNRPEVCKDKEKRAMLPAGIAFMPCKAVKVKVPEATEDGEHKAFLE